MRYKCLQGHINPWRYGTASPFRHSRAKPDRHPKRNNESFPKYRSGGRFDNTTIPPTCRKGSNSKKELRILFRRHRRRTADFGRFAPDEAKQILRSDPDLQSPNSRTDINDGVLQNGNMEKGRERFFIPIGEQPPRMYPVVGSNSRTGIRSAFLLPEMRAAAFRSTS